MAERYKPNDPFPADGTVFPNGTSFEIWRGRNCHGCRKFRPEAATSRDGCPIEVALAMAACLDGRIKAKIALRGGFAVEGPNGSIVQADDPPSECPERRGYDEPDDRVRRGPRPPEGQEDLLDPRNQPVPERRKAVA